MTREDAIKELQSYAEHSWGDLNDAFEMAISALRQQECVGDVNKSLTIDELRKMDGEPVWIKLFDQDEAFWVLRNEWVDTRNPEPMILLHMRWYSHADYGKTWLAYRQKPEEDDHDERKENENV